MKSILTHSFIFIPDQESDHAQIVVRNPICTWQARRSFVEQRMRPPAAQEAQAWT
jgi:hypothetical protein